jgi:hypothetical protein
MFRPRRGLGFRTGRLGTNKSFHRFRVTGSRVLGPATRPNRLPVDGRSVRTQRCRSFAPSTGALNLRQSMCRSAQCRGQVTHAAPQSPRLKTSHERPGRAAVSSQQPRAQRRLQRKAGRRPIIGERLKVVWIERPLHVLRGGHRQPSFGALGIRRRHHPNLGGQLKTRH